VTGVPPSFVFALDPACLLIITAEDAPQAQPSAGIRPQDVVLDVVATEFVLANTIARRGEQILD